MKSSVLFKGLRTVSPDFQSGARQNEAKRLFILLKHSLKLVVPITDWKPYFASNLWHIYIEPTAINGLKKQSAADVFQLRSVDERRFVRKLGISSTIELQEITIAIAALIEYQETSDEA